MEESESRYYENEYSELLAKHETLLEAIKRKDSALNSALKFVKSSTYVLDRHLAIQDIQEAIDAGRRKSHYE